MNKRIKVFNAVNQIKRAIHKYTKNTEQEEIQQCVDVLYQELNKLYLETLRGNYFYYVDHWVVINQHLEHLNKLLGNE